MIEHDAPAPIALHKFGAELRGPLRDFFHQISPGYHVWMLVSRMAVQRGRLSFAEKGPLDRQKSGDWPSHVLHLAPVDFITDYFKRLRS
jgi:hypothetical protein